MPTGKNPKGARSSPFSPMRPRKKPEEVKEEKPREVPIGRFVSKEEYRRLKEMAEEPKETLDQGGQHDPSAEEKSEVDKK